MPREDRLQEQKRRENRKKQQLDWQTGIEKRKAERAERAKDPRNWEYHYKAPGRQQANERKTAAQRNDDARKTARRRAERTAANEGQQIYEIQQIQAETDRVEASTARFKKAQIEGKKQRSSRAATAVGQQRMLATRKAGRSSGQSTVLFDAPLRMRA